PEAKVAQFTADTNPHIWGENAWLWPSMRMDILTRINLGQHGDVDSEHKSSAGGWTMLRAKPRGGVKTRTGSGSLISRMREEDKFSAGGWIMLRAKPGGGVKTGTGSGSLLSRMGDEDRRGGAGWEIYQEGGRFTLNLVSAPPESLVEIPEPKAERKKSAKAGN